MIGPASPVVRSGQLPSPSTKATHSIATGIRAPVSLGGRALEPAEQAELPGGAARFARGRSALRRPCDAGGVPTSDRPGETSHCPSPRQQPAVAYAPNLGADLLT